MPIGDQTETFAIQERCIETQAARIAELEDALKALLDENSASMLVRSFDGWHAAVEKARAVLENR